MLLELPVIRWIKKLAEVPETRLLVSIITTLIAGVLASAFVVDITVDGKIHWAETAHSRTFYFLMAFAAIWLVLQLVFLDHDRDVAKFADDEHCLAYVRKMQLEAAAAYLKRNPIHAVKIDFTAMMNQLNIKGAKK